MYHPSVVGSRLVALEKADRENPKLKPSDRFCADPPTEAKRRAMFEQLADVYDDEESRLTRVLTDDEKRWMRHESMRCTVDFRWYLRYVKIRHWEGYLSDFSPNIAQELVLQRWGEIEKEGLAIMMIQLKARQLGVTTLTELAIAHRAQFYPDVNAVVASADPEKSEKMFKMIDLAWSHMPWWLMPTSTRKTQKMVEFGGLNSGVKIEHGSKFQGIARGTTPNVVHLSEVASYDDPENTIDASLLHAFHETAWSFMILESTAEGYDWFEKKWQSAKKGWPRRESSFCPLFLPWFIGFDLYPTDIWLKKQPIPPDWVPPDFIKQHAEKARVYVNANDLLSQHLGSNWRMSREQMWYYRVKFDEAKSEKTVQKFLQEMPADDFEAFQLSGRSAFPQETIQMYDYRTTSRAPLAVYGVRGYEDEVPARFWPARSDVDTSRPPLRIPLRWSSQLQTEVELVPLRFQGYSERDPAGVIFLFEAPDDDSVYGVGVDTGDGVGEDGSAVEVMKKGTPEYGPVQCAEFCSPYINAYNLWPVVMALATLYSPQRRQSKLAIECLRNGEAVQLECRKRGWDNFHLWQRSDNRKIDPSKATKLGWFTNAWSRPQLIDLLMSALNDEWLEIFSPFLVKEMATLSQDIDTQSFSADHGHHDDRFMATGIILYSLHALEMKAFKNRERGERRFIPTDDEKAPEDPVWKPGWQDRDVDYTPARRYNRTMLRYYRGVAQGVVAKSKRLR